MAVTDMNPALQVLHAHLAAEAPNREALIARFVCALATLCTLCAIAIGATQGWELALPIVALTTAIALYDGAVFLWLRAGHYHRAIPWLNMLIEISAPAVVFALDTVKGGPFYAANGPPIVIWASLVTFMALRANPTLALVAGVLSALEYLAIYALLFRPQLGPDAPATYLPLIAFIKALFLVCGGAGGATVARHLLTKSEEALTAVREQDVMGKYLLHERIGSGGMAEVFRATYCPAGGFRKTVAVKKILPAYGDNEEFVRMFMEEARLGATLTHSNIVQVLDVGRHGSSYFMAMEFVDGTALSSLVQSLARRGRRLPLAAVSCIGAQISLALEFAHTRRTPEGTPLVLVHRDINPPNILLTRLGDAKLSDFGIARAASAVRVTRAGQVRGKVGYMAPEQAVDGEIDGRTDLFALGLTLWEALTGEPYFVSRDDDAVMAETVEFVPRRISEVRADVPKEFEELLLALLAKEPADRIASGRLAHDRFAALTGDAAPFPQGPALLRAAIEEAAAILSFPEQKAVDTELLPSVKHAKA